MDFLYYKIPFRIDGIELDEKGAPTGIFRGKANATLRTNILNSYPNKNREENIRKLIPKLLEVGITTVNAMEGGYMYSDKDANFIYEHIADFPIDIVLFYQCLDLDKVREKKIKKNWGKSLYRWYNGSKNSCINF